MLTKNQEMYVFQHLSLVDMGRVQDSLQKMREVDDPFVKEAIFRAALIPAKSL